MDEQDMGKRLNELLGEFGARSDLEDKNKKLAKLVEQAESSRRELDQSISKLHEGLDYLRVCIKYQAFDLEATRRENEYLRKLLQEENR